MEIVVSILRSLSRRYKLLILTFVDLWTAFACWIVFGPPFTAVLVSNFELSLYEVIFQNYINFIIPSLATFIYFINSGFYRSSIRYSESKDLITRALKGASIFGLSWGIVYAAEYEIIRNQYLITTVLKSIFLAYVFYAFLQISRDLARILLNPKSKEISGKPVMIYGAGAAGNELYHAIKHNLGINIIGFFDNSSSLIGGELNIIKIYG